MRNKYILIGVVGIVVGVLLASVVVVLAGNLDSSAVPGSTSSFTLADIYARLNVGTAGSQSTFTEPAAGPGTGTMHTLNQIMGVAPAKDDTNGATIGDVANGKTFWGLTAGEWATQTGTAVCAACTGDAAAGDVLTGKTFSNAGGTGIAGTMPDKEGDNASTAQAQAGGVNYFTAPQGYYDGDDRVSATDAEVAALDADVTAGNIVSDTVIFGVTGTYPWAPVPKTGAGDLTEYTFVAGEDGHAGMRKGVTWPNPRFTDNSNFTVTDNLTGLIWLKKANCYGTRSWADALSDANALANGTCSLSDGSSAGDWRLPNVREMQSLVYFGVFNPAVPNTAGTAKWAEEHPFDNVQSNEYWSSTTRAASNTTNAWIVSLTYGTVNYVLKSESHYVWPVRGGQ